MKDIRSALRQILLDDAEVTALAGTRLYPINLPQGITQPSVVYFLVTEESDYHNRGLSNCFTARYQVDAWAQSADAAVQLADACYDALSGFRGIVICGSSSPQDEIVVHGVFHDMGRDEYDSAAKLHTRRRDYSIHYALYDVPRLLIRGRAIFRGAGSLSVGTIARAQARAAITGTGILSVAPAAALQGRAAISGAGTLSARTASVLRAEAIFGGVAGIAVGSELAGQLEAKATFHGAGEFRAVSRSAVQISSIINGSGSVSIETTSSPIAIISFVQVRYEIAPPVDHVGEARFSGAGALSTTTRAALQGRISFNGVAASSVGTSGILRGRTTIAGAGSLVPYPEFADIREAGAAFHGIGSLAFGLIAAGDPPVLIIAPIISGDAEDGETLSVSNGIWTSLELITYSYQWYRAVVSGGEVVTSGGEAVGVAIPGATAATYALTAADVGEYIFCIVTACNDNGCTNGQSDLIGIVGP